jgi:hypothetical protein
MPQCDEVLGANLKARQSQWMRPLRPRSGLESVKKTDQIEGLGDGASTNVAAPRLRLDQ